VGRTKTRLAIQSIPPLAELQTTEPYISCELQGIRRATRTVYRADGGGLSAGSGAGMMGMLSGLLDTDKDGSVVDDIADMAGKFFR